MCKANTVYGYAGIVFSCKKIVSLSLVNLDIDKNGDCSDTTKDTRMVEKYVNQK